MRGMPSSLGIRSIWVVCGIAGLVLVALAAAGNLAYQEPARFFGKYRAVVEDNVDPSGLGRIQVEVPAVLGEGTLSWAMPCVPFAGPGVGFVMIPSVGVHVWVEFEGGDPSRPIWTGCFWADGELPTSDAGRHDAPSTRLLQTEVGALTFRETPEGGEIELSLPSGAGLLIDAQSGKWIPCLSGVGNPEGHGSQCDAFLVRVCSDPGVKGAQRRGSVENVETGEKTSFVGLGTVPEIIAQLLMD